MGIIRRQNWSVVGVVWTLVVGLGINQSVQASENWSSERRWLSRRSYEDLDPKEHTCELALHQSDIDGDTLWVHGGFVGYDNGTKTTAPNNFVRKIDFSKSFDLSSRQAPITYLTPPDKVPELAQGMLWAHKGIVYEFSGRPEETDKNFPGWNGLSLDGKDFWRWDTSGNDWSLSAMEDVDGKEFGGPVAALGMKVGSLGKGYHLGGARGEDKGKRMMSVFDFEKEEWRRSSSIFDVVEQGALVHLPVGEKGILVIIGGRKVLSHDLGDSMERIDMFNLNEADGTLEGRWATPQMSTSTAPGGQFPTARRLFCAWAVAAPDLSSFQIYMYGGLSDSFSQDTFRDLWVLTLPSFEWILLDDGSSGPPNPDYSQTHPGQREGHTCHVVRNSVAVMFGGRVTPDFSRACETTALYAFDMNQQKWVERYDAEKAKERYKVPEKVRKVIGGTAEGGSTKLPKGGIADRTLRAQFASAAEEGKKNPLKDDEPSNNGDDEGKDTGSEDDKDEKPKNNSPGSNNNKNGDSKNGNNNSGSKDSSTNNSNPDGSENNNNPKDPESAKDGDASSPGMSKMAMIGAGVGGGVGLLLLLGAAIFFTRRQTKKRYAKKYNSTEPPSRPSIEKLKSDQAGGGYYNPGSSPHGSHSPIGAEMPGESERFMEMSGEDVRRMEMAGLVEERAEMEVPGGHAYAYQNNVGGRGVRSPRSPVELSADTKGVIPIKYGGSEF